MTLYKKNSLGSFSRSLDFEVTFQKKKLLIIYISSDQVKMKDRPQEVEPDFWYITFLSSCCLSFKSIVCMNKAFFYLTISMILG